ncbi:acid phosphatase [Burkholderia sp. Ac-20379]|uniref:acid phosphatase n=1 Tax=Burkholderia sp. Ac-20379 TaxID=2703900 RepID=UPI00198000FA|nr:phosphatase PAP2 family protein [Burkholderia sp. Ac-20379]MBN3723067.1 phosphatase PAP2 family protein [Burkholderia sp. Ac-20379]
MSINDNITRAVIAASAVSFGLTVSFAQARDSVYLSPDEIDVAALLAPPPEPGSAAQRRDLEAVLTVQNTRTSEEVAAGIADVQKSVFRFADVLGPAFMPENLPKLAALFEVANHEASLAVKPAKAYFHRARPYVASSQVHPTVPEHAAGAYESYPSGHATMGYLDAILLANMVPEKRAEIYARGRLFGEHRVVDGVHYPSDVEAGRIDATVIAAQMMRNPTFKADFLAARTELRGALGMH